MAGSKAERFSGGQFGFGVEALHDAAGELALGVEPVEDQLPMLAPHPGDPFHGLQL